MNYAVSPITIVGAGLRRVGKIECRRCKARTASVEVEPDPFSSAHRAIYWCHGTLTFRVIDKKSLLDPGGLFRWLTEPVFAPMAWFEVAANDRRRALPSVAR